MQRLFGFMCLVLIATVVPASAQERLKVVASFSILGDFVRNVGGDRVSVTTLALLPADLSSRGNQPSKPRPLMKINLASAIFFASPGVGE